MTSLSFNPPDFLHSLCAWIVLQAAARTPAVTLNYGGTPPCSLWRNVLPESGATDPATVLRTYNGSPLRYDDRLPALAIQCQTEGSDDAVSTQLQTVFECLLDANGEPIRGVTIDGLKAADNSADGTYLIRQADPLQRPGVISRDDRGRATWGFNFDIYFMKAS